MKLLGTSKISTDNKITIIKEVAELLKLKQGNLVVFYLNDAKDVVLKKANL